MGTTCSECKLDVGDTPGDEKCPHCGELSKRNTVIAVPTGVLSITGHAPTVIVGRYWRSLVQVAERLFKAKEFAVSVVVSATACEVVADRAMAKAFSSKGVGDLEEPVMRLLMSTALHSDKTRKLYTALTGDSIEKEPFWPAYKRLVELRNKTVHKGSDVEKTAARECLDTAIEFTDHVEKHNSLQ